jgi:hypothetical protein
MEDKLLHAIVGIVIVFIGLRIASIRVTITTLIIAAIGKELFDLIIQNERFDTFDFLVTILSGVIAVYYIKFKNRPLHF